MTVLAHVPNIIVVGDDWKEQVLRQILAKGVELKTLNRLKYILEIEVSHSKKVFSYLNRKCVTNLLQETGKTARKPISNSIQSNLN